MSQDFPTYSQATGKETLKSCKLCKFQSHSKNKLAEHTKNNHPEYNLCKDRVIDEEELGVVFSPI